jgi:hypothetical protein
VSREGPWALESLAWSQFMLSSDDVDMDSLFRDHTHDKDAELKRSSVGKVAGGTFLSEMADTKMFLSGPDLVKALLQCGGEVEAWSGQVVRSRDVDGFIVLHNSEDLKRVLTRRTSVMDNQDNRVLSLTAPSGSQSRDDWISHILPTCLSFYCTLLKARGQSRGKQMQPPVVFIAADEMGASPFMGVTIVTALLLCFFDQGCRLHRPGVRRAHFTKQDIRETVGLVFAELGMKSDQALPQKYMRELNIFYSAPNGPWATNMSLWSQFCSNEQMACSDTHFF